MSNFEYEKLVKYKEVQEILGVGRNKVISLDKDNKIISKLEGSTRLFFWSSIQKYLKSELESEMISRAANDT